jgi:uncharacterized membrane protein YccC
VSVWGVLGCVASVVLAVLVLRAVAYLVHRPHRRRRRRELADRLAEMIERAPVRDVQREYAESEQRRAEIMRQLRYEGGSTARDDGEARS